MGSLRPQACLKPCLLTVDELPFPPHLCYHSLIQFNVLIYRDEILALFAFFFFNDTQYTNDMFNQFINRNMSMFLYEHSIGTKIYLSSFYFTITKS